MFSRNKITERIERGLIAERLRKGSVVAILDVDLVNQIGVGFVEHRTENGWYGVRLFGEGSINDWPASCVWGIS